VGKVTWPRVLYLSRASFHFLFLCAFTKLQKALLRLSVSTLARNNSCWTDFHCLVLDASVKIYHENSAFVKIGPTSILTIFVNCQASIQIMSTVHAGLCMLCFFTTHCSIRLTVRSELDVPTVATRRLHACHHARAPSGGRWNCGREMSGNFV
jgi:hypothetical protein